MNNSLGSLDYKALLEPLEELRKCNICPRNCNVDRWSSRSGYCKADQSFSISSICIHRGEEPAISGEQGICNIFFTNCNLQCVYCQNFQISSNRLKYDECKMELRDVLAQIIDILRSGINIVGFVSPSHFVPQVKIIINALRELGYDPTFVWNTNAYDKVETVRDLENYIDVWLPDYKYSDPALSKELSEVKDYPDIALKAIREMYRQCGSKLMMDDRGYATKGIIIRHLVLPGHVENSLEVLRNIAFELSPRMHVSLMSQYYPTHHVREHPVLGRTLTRQEYGRVVQELEDLGITNGWVQHLMSHENYRPDFEREHPFEG